MSYENARIAHDHMQELLKENNYRHKKVDDWLESYTSPRERRIASPDIHLDASVSQYEQAYAAFMHEMGHVKTTDFTDRRRHNRDSFFKDIFGILTPEAWKDEVVAWKWARENSKIPWSDCMNQYMLIALQTYWKSMQHSDVSEEDEDFAQKGFYSTFLKPELQLKQKESI